MLSISAPYKKRALQSIITLVFATCKLAFNDYPHNTELKVRTQNNYLGAKEAKPC